MLLKDPATGLLLRRLLYDNLLANSRYCCCGYPYPASGSGSGGGAFDCECCDCARYFFTLNGVTGGGACNELDQTYLMPVSVECEVWTGTANGISATLTRLDGDPCGTYELVIGPHLGTASTATYRLAAEQWSCNGCNIMSLISSSGCTFPATVEVCCG